MKPLLLALLGTMGGLSAQVTIERPPLPAPEFSVYGGELLDLNLVVEAPAGARISLRYDLIQIADGLLAPLAQGWPIMGSQERDSRGRLRVKVPVPAVEGPARLMLRFSLDPPPEPSPLPCNTAFLNVFPKPKPGERAKLLAAAEAKSARRLAVFGESPAIRSFFKAEGIAFEDLGAEWPREFPRNRLLLGEATTDQWEKLQSSSPGGDVLVFVSSGALSPPGVYRTVLADRTITRVTLPVPAGLFDSPLEQNLFLDLISQQLHPSSLSAL